jgi:adenine-specific DNA-methyltransferase
VANDSAGAETLAEVARLRQRITQLEGQGGFGLVWEDLPEDVERLLADEIPVIAPVPKFDIRGTIASESPHVLIEGDNLHALYTLQATHREAIDLIYIDPPYNRGGDFRYNDKIVDRENSYRHSAWLSFMAKRLRLAKSLLKASGVLFVSIDSVEAARLELLCQQIFGESNVVATLAIVNNLKGRSDDKHIATAHESLLVIAKDESLLSITGFALDDSKRSEYKYQDDKGAWKPVGLQKTGKNSDRADRPNLYYPIYWDESAATLSLERTSKNDHEIYPLFTDGREGTWRWGREKFIANAATELSVKRQPRGPIIYVKMRSESEDGTERTLKPKSIWQNPKFDSGSATRLLKEMLGGKVFDNPKPLPFIEDILSVGTHKNATILDFFAGTGTTLHAAASLNDRDGGTRRVILVTNNENDICRSVTQPRISAVLTGDWAVGKKEPLPGSLAFFKTDFITRRKSLDRMRADISKHTVDLVSIKEGAIRTQSKAVDLTMLFGSGKSVAVVTSLYPEHLALRAEADKAAREGDARYAYLFTWSDQGMEAEAMSAWDGWQVEPLPAEMLAALRRFAPTETLFPVEFPEDQRS